MGLCVWPRLQVVLEVQNEAALRALADQLTQAGAHALACQCAYTRHLKGCIQHKHTQHPSTL